MFNIHPKVAGGAIGSSLGILLVAILASIHGVHLTPEANAAIPSFFALVGGYLAPSPVTPVTGNNQPPPVAAAPPPPAQVPPAA